ncbi:hypothetical protein Syun_010759 [Stephania yunnanensis]|uniref:Non-specific lipid-transfer protein n=1 Tax=Stephania yunnanensis TaxID=152371 RepID=A0AAP0KI11_9MAGN
MKTSFALLTLSAALLMLIACTEGAIPCSTVDAKAASCIAFASGKAPKPAQGCCAGLQQLAQSVKSVQDKKDICACLKGAVKSFPAVQDKFLSQIPGACGIKVGFPVSLNTNCQTIQ